MDNYFNCHLKKNKSEWCQIEKSVPHFSWCMRSLVGLLKLLGCSRSQGKEGRQMEPCIFVKTLLVTTFSVSKAVDKSCYVSCSVLKICQAMPDNSGMFSVGIYLQCIVKERYFSYDLLKTKQKRKSKYLYTYIHI